jgi:hypothetical protein
MASKGEPIIFVDLDQTLVHTLVQPAFHHRKFDDRKSFWFGWHHSATKHRPGADEFLKQLAAQYTVMILTMGASPFQTRVLKTLNLLKYIEGVFGIDNYANVVRPERFLLIDDMPVMSPLAEEKLRWLGRETRLMSAEQAIALYNAHYIQCEAYYGTAAVPCLTELFPLISVKLELQTAAAPINQILND